MWICFLLPFAFLSMHLGVKEIHYLFYTTSAILIVGSLVYGLEDHRAKRRFSCGMLLYLFTMLMESSRPCLCRPLTFRITLSKQLQPDLTKITE